MGIRFNVPLPGPFSYSARVTPVKSTANLFKGGLAVGAAIDGAIAQNRANVQARNYARQKMIFSLLQDDNPYTTNYFAQVTPAHRWAAKEMVRRSAIDGTVHPATWANRNARIDAAEHMGFMAVAVADLPAFQANPWFDPRQMALPKFPVVSLIFAILSVMMSILCLLEALFIPEEGIMISGTVVFGIITLAFFSYFAARVVQYRRYR